MFLNKTEIFRIIYDKVINILICLLIFLQYHRERRFKCRPIAQYGIQQGEYNMSAMIAVL